MFKRTPRGGLQRPRTSRGRELELGKPGSRTSTSRSPQCRSAGRRSRCHAPAGPAAAASRSGTLEFNMKGPAAVREQAQASGAEAQEGAREPAGRVEEHHRIRQTAIELQPPIHIRDMQREPHQRNIIGPPRRGIPGRRSVTCSCRGGGGRRGTRAPLRDGLTALDVRRGALRALRPGTPPVPKRQARLAVAVEARRRNPGPLVSTAREADACGVGPQGCRVAPGKMTSSTRSAWTTPGP